MISDQLDQGSIVMVRLQDKCNSWTWDETAKQKAVCAGRREYNYQRMLDPYPHISRFVFILQLKPNVPVQSEPMLICA